MLGGESRRENESMDPPPSSIASTTVCMDTQLMTKVIHPPYSNVLMHTNVDCTCLFGLTGRQDGFDRKEALYASDT